MDSYALTIHLPSCYQVPYFITCIPYLLAKVLAHFICSYLGGEGGMKWIYGIGYQVGTMLTQFWFIHNEVIWVSKGWVPVASWLHNPNWWLVHVIWLSAMAYNVRPLPLVCSVNTLY